MTWLAVRERVKESEKDDGYIGLTCDRSKGKPTSSSTIIEPEKDVVIGGHRQSRSSTRLLR